MPDPDEILHRQHAAGETVPRRISLGLDADVMLHNPLAHVGSKC